MNAIMENPNWQEEAGNHCKSQFNSWCLLMNGDDTNDIITILCKGMHNLQLPVFTFQHAIIPLIKGFIKSDAVLYFFVFTVTKDKKFGRYLCKCMCDVIGLMKRRTKNNKDNSDLVPCTG